MNFLEIITLLRQQLDDQDTSSPLWSDDELKLYINRSIQEACMRSNLILDSSTSEICVIQITEDVAEYTIDRRILEIKRFVYGDDNLVLSPFFHRGMDHLTERSGSYDSLYFQSRWELREGYPSRYIVDLNSRIIRLDYIPTEDTTARLTVYRLPLTDLVEDTDIPEIPEHFHFDLIYWAKKLAYEKLDSEAFDSQLSADSERKFIEVFGTKQTANYMENQQIRRTKRRAKGHYF